MRIPPYYENPGWQRFFSGMFCGALISWIVFLYLFGQLQDRQLEKIVTQQAVINELKSKVEVWEQDYQALNEKNKKSLTIQKIEIYFQNDKKLKLDSLTSITLKNAVMHELGLVLNKNISAVAENKRLLLQTIENKVYNIEEQRFQLKVTQLYLFTTMEIYLEIKQLT